MLRLWCTVEEPLDIDDNSDFSDELSQQEFSSSKIEREITPTNEKLQLKSMFIILLIKILSCSWVAFAKVSFNKLFDTLYTPSRHSSRFSNETTFLTVESKLKIDSLVS